tara:strand:- start:333 stop:743 length:411 start_codon:yes stop_codon:yes gene_type:complete
MVPIDPSVAALASELSAFAPEKKQRVLRSVNMELKETVSREGALHHEGFATPSSVGEVGKLRLELEKTERELFEVRTNLYKSLGSFKSGCGNCGFARKANGGVCYNRSCITFKENGRMNKELIFDAKALAAKIGSA